MARTDLIAAEVQCFDLAARVVELATHIVHAAESKVPAGGSVYFDAAHGSIARIREALDRIETALPAATKAAA